MEYRALITSPRTLTDMARWVAGELRRIELAKPEATTVTSGAYDFDEGDASTTYTLGDFDFDGGAA